MMYCVEFMPKKLKQTDIFKAIDWVMLELELPDHIDISIEFKHLSNGEHAAVINEDYDSDEDDAWVFNIEVSKHLEKEDVVRSIFHEMIHIKQMSQGRFKCVNGCYYWLGKKVPELNYMDRPWEVEAFEYEEKLLDKYEKHVYAIH